MNEETRQIIEAFKYYYSPEFVGPRHEMYISFVDSFFGCGPKTTKNESSMRGTQVELMVLDDYYDPEPTQCCMEYAEPPKPKPSKSKPFIKQARRQSFRQVMRSVNRNR